MTGSYREHRDRWESLSEIDYFSAFIKAWLAFNAYYRDAYTDNQDREIIDTIKNSESSNPIRSHFLPLIDSTDPEGELFKSYIGELHIRLEAYMLYSGKNTNKRQVTMRDVLLRTSKKADVVRTFRNCNYEVKTKFNGRGKFTGSSAKLTNRTGVILLEVSEQKYDRKIITDHASFPTLTPEQQGRLTAFYDSIDPSDYGNLTNMGQPTIKCGRVEFRAIPEDIFAGTIETIYTLRNLLFHGELNPNQKASTVYEPAYYIVRQLLSAVK